MSEFKKWKVTAPDGEMDLLFIAPNKELALDQAFTHIAKNYSPPATVEILRQAGYRAEPIEEPKMVTVRAEDLDELYRAWYDRGLIRSAVGARLRAALDGAK